MRGRDGTAAAAWLLAIAWLMTSACCGCAEQHYKDWAGDSIAFGNIRLTAPDGSDLTERCAGGALATDDYVPGTTYSYRGAGRDHLVYVSRLDSDGSYFSAAAPHEAITLSLNCTQVLTGSLLRETDHRIHVDVGTVIVPGEKAALFLGNLNVHLESDGRVTVVSANEDDAHHRTLPLPIAKRQLPVVQIPPASIVGPAGWSSSTSTHMNVLFP